AVATGKGGGVSVTKSDTHIELHAPKGLFLQGIDWLPKFELTRIKYELGTGQFEIDVGGVHQGHYREGMDVGPVTEDIISGVVKSLVGPHLPPQAREIGIVGKEEDKQSGPGPRGTKLHSAQVSGVGALEILLQKGDNLNIAATEREAMVSTQFGLIINMPDIETSARVRYVKYHFQTGEVQIDGLGAFENAMVEAAIMKFITPMLPKEMQSSTPVDDFMKGLPQDRKGRRQLMESDDLDLWLQPGTRFDVSIGGGSLKFTAQPGIKVDAPALFNYEFKKIDFKFSEGKFKVDTSGDNIIAGIFNGVAEGKAEKQLNQMLLPLMPQEMLQPGYDLTADPHLAEKIQQIVANFASKKKEEPAAAPQRSQRPRPRPGGRRPFR